MPSIPPGPGAPAYAYDIDLLDLLARMADTTSAEQENVNARGLWLRLNVTANPGGLETLTVAIDAKVAGVFKAITAFPAIAAATNASYFYHLYPGAVDPGAANVEVAGVALPREWRVFVDHSGAGSWTYSLHASTIV